MFAHPSSYDHSFPPTYFLPPLAPIPPPPDGISRKRPAEDSEAEAGSAKRVAKTPEVVFRLLVPSGKIGKVIGKQGTQIKQLREETTARIKIPDTMSSTEDRVILISSKEEACLPQTAAETSLLRLVTVLLEEQEGTTTATIGPQHHVAPNLTRLLIAGSQAGSLIGKAGAVINNIRESSGATVRILPSDKLPPCSAASDTDRLVQISGEIPQVCKALELVAAKLRTFLPVPRVNEERYVMNKACRVWWKNR
ncbi:hypothetical protein O6H91_12G021800 [Diphasiastrum complanatum]|uniref:Uncharacterized protein n=1 Tax=Diphasiastrum complanatum TaxID=34168 RepID=A0ACC2BZI6_DIPCM|nr:hypothetical protein O6H91_12G021800 [Diphasiastrum complanatum]